MVSFVCSIGESRSNIAKSHFSSKFYQDAVTRAQKTFKGEEGLEQELASDWARSPGPFLLLSKVRDVNQRRQQRIPSPKPHGGKNPCPFISRRSREEIMRSPCSVHERDSGLSIFESLATRRILILKSYAEIRSRCKCGQRRNCHLGNPPPTHTSQPKLPSCIS